jgi:hypothetical protein
LRTFKLEEVGDEGDISKFRTEHEKWEKMPRI